MKIPDIVIMVPSITAAIAWILPLPYWYTSSGFSSDFLMAKKLNIDTSISNSESMADANTATDPLARPMTSFTNTKIEATELETNVARFCGDILFPCFRS